MKNVFKLLNGKKVIIYGAGKIGKRVYQSLLAFGVKTTLFWDKNADKIGNIDKVPVTYPFPIEHRNDYAIIIAIAAENVAYEIANKLSKVGFNSIIYDSNIINSLIYHACKKEVTDNNFIFDLITCHICPVKDIRCDIFNDYVAKKIAKGVISTTKDTFVIPRLGVLVTNRCNLSCKGCINSLHNSKGKIDLPPEEIVADLTKICDATDLISKVVIVGGEAFIHPDLYAILEEILKLPKIGIVQVITNGTIKPKNYGLFDLMANKKVIVEISNYGAYLPQKLQDNIKSFSLSLAEYNVSYLCMNNLQWFDFGDFSNRNYTKEEHHNVYLTCCSVSNDLFNGKLYKCSRSAFGTIFKKIPDYSTDYVDIRTTKKSLLKRKIIEFLDSESPHACQHCNGSSTKVIQAGVQRQ